MAEHASGSTEIYATPKEIMAVIADFEAYPEWAGQLEEAKVLAKDRRGRGTRVAFKVNTPLFPAEYTLDYTYEPRDAGLAWTFVEGTLEDLAGSYVLEPLDGGTTRVTYDLSVALDVPVPGLLKRQAAKQIVKTALADLKRRVEST
jgi:ribosome-associated toxin RatA of RatAB toxin-antitoxin module